MVRLAFNLPLMLLISTNFVAYSSSRQAFLPSSSDEANVVSLDDEVNVTKEVPDEVSDLLLKVTSDSRIMSEGGVATDNGFEKVEFVDANSGTIEELVSSVHEEQAELGVEWKSAVGDDMVTADSFRLQDESFDPANGVTPGLILAGNVPRPADQLSALRYVGSEDDLERLQPHYNRVNTGMFFPVVHPSPDDVGAFSGDISEIFSSVVETVGSFVNATSRLAAPAVAFKARATAPFVEAIRNVGRRLLKTADALGERIGVNLPQLAGRLGIKDNKKREDDVPVMLIPDADDMTETVNDVLPEVEEDLGQNQAPSSAAEGESGMGEALARSLEKRSVPSSAPEMLFRKLLRLRERGARDEEELVSSDKFGSSPVESRFAPFGGPFVTVEPNLVASMVDEMWDQGTSQVEDALKEFLDGPATTTPLEASRPICETQLKSMTTAQCFRVEEYTITECDGVKGCGIFKADVDSFINLCATPSKELFCKMNNTRLNNAPCRIYHFKFTIVLSSSRYCARQLEMIDGQLHFAI